MTTDSDTREADEWDRLVGDLNDHIDRLERELSVANEKLAEARKDSERLDWLDSLRKGSAWKWSLSLHDPKCVFFGKNSSYGHDTARYAIDAAMKEDK